MTKTTPALLRRYADNLRRFDLAHAEVLAGRMTVEEAARVFRVHLVALRLDEELAHATAPQAHTPRA